MRRHRVQRSLFRVAALLEVVNLELSRVHKGRDDYKAKLKRGAFDQDLNVDLLEAILLAYLPRRNRAPRDDYAALLFDLKRCKVATGPQLIAIIDKHRAEALSNDKMVLKALRSGNSTYAPVPQLTEKGAFYSHVGLVQNMLNLEYGSDWRRKRNTGPANKKAQ